MNKKSTKLIAALALLAVFALPIRVWADSYVKVTSTDQLVAGDVYIIATSTAIATAYNNNNLTTVASGFTESSGTITTSTASPMEFTLGTSGSSYTLIMSDGKYLGYSGSSTTFRNTQTNANDNKEKWTIAYNSTYSLYTIVNVNTTGRHIGVGNSVFKAYNSMSSNAPATLYKKVVVPTEPSITVGSPTGIPPVTNAVVDYEYQDGDNINISYENITIYGYYSFLMQYYDYDAINDIYTEADEPTWISSSVAGTGTYHVEYTVDENTGADRHAYFKVYAYNGSTPIYSNLVHITQTARPAPSIAVNPSNLTGFTYQHDAGPSTAQSFAASGSNLTANVSVSVPADGNFEICATQDGTYGNSLTLTPSSGTLASTNVYVRLKAGKAIAENYTGTVTLSSTGATNQTVSLSGSVTGYTVTYNGNGSTGGTVPTDATAYTYNHSVTVLGNTGNLAKTGHTFAGWNTQADGNGTGYAANATFSITANTTLYAQWTVNTHYVTLPTANDYGTYEMNKENPVAYGTEVTLTYNKAAGYEAYVATWSINGTAISGNKFNMPDEDVTVTVAVTEAHGTAENPYTVAEARAAIDAGTGTSNVYTRGIVSSSNGLSGSTITYFISDDGTSTNTLQVYKGKGLNNSNFTNGYDVQPGDVVVVYGTISYYSTASVYQYNNGNYLHYIKPVIAPNATSVGNLENFSYIGNGPSAAQNFTVRGRNLTENLVLTVSEDYELCETSDGTYASSLSLTTTNSTEKTIYVRMKANLGAGTHNGTVTMTSADAVTKTVDLTGSVSYSITYPASYTHGNVTTAPNTAEVGATVTIVTAPETYYYPSAIAFSTTPEPEDVTISGNNISFTMPAGNVVISSITFEQYENVTITYSVNGNTTTVAAAIVEAGNSTTLPTDVDDLIVNSVTYEFEGWTVDESNITSSSILTGSYTPTGDVTLYAVYSITETGTPVTAYRLVESDLEDWSGEYLIVYHDDSHTYVLDSHGGNTNTNTYGTYYDINTYYSGENKSIAYNSTTSAYKITVSTVTTGYYSLYDDGDNAFLGCNSDNNVGLRWDTQYNSTDDDWTMSKSSIVSRNKNAREIKWNDGTTKRFATYKSTSTSTDLRTIQLYRKVTTTPSVTKYYALIKDITGAETMANVYTSHILTVKNGGVLSVTGNESNCLPENLIIEDGGKLVTYSTGVQATVQKNISKATQWGEQTDPENPYTPDGWYFIASPVNGADFPTGTVDDQDIYQLDWASKKWLNLQKDANSSLLDAGFQRGTGYLYASEAGNTLSVAGEILPLSNDDNAIVTLANDGWNLIGNPLTCKVTVSTAFSALNNASSVANMDANSTIDPFQGIAVWGNANDEVTFTKAATQNAATPGNSALQMTVAQNIVTRGNATSTTVDNAVISFNEGSVLPKFTMLESNANLYIPQGTEEYAIVSSEAQGEMPVSFRANENGQYTLTINAENVEMGYLHLIDNMTGADIDLLQTPSYTFNAKTTDYESRFRLVFAANNEDGSSTGSETFAYYSNGNWMISNEGDATLLVIDALGRILSNECISGTVSKIINAPAGVYVLRLINGENVKTQKIIVR